MNSNTLVSLLDELHTNNVRYALWKNFAEINKDNIFQNDLDIYVEEEDRSKFVVILKKYTVFQMGYRHSSFDRIEHYFVQDELIGKFIHLHIYYKLYTGHTWVKEFQILFSDQAFLENNFISFGIYKFKTFPPNVLQKINDLRTQMKTSNFLNNVYYSRDKTGHQREYLFLSRLQHSNEDYNEVCFVKRLKTHSYLWNLLKALVTRIFCSTRKRLRKMKTGKIIAISGIDGSGKSTIVKQITETLSDNQFGVKVVRPGRIVRNVSTGLQENVKKKPNIIKCLLVALIRLYICNLKANYFRLRGNLVISDRWPGVGIGQMDSPKLSSGMSAYVEQFFYSKIRMADTIIFLKVPLNTLLERNNNRSKQGKETNAEISERFKKNIDFRPRVKDLIFFNNERDLIESKRDILKIISQICGIE